MFFRLVTVKVGNFGVSYSRLKLVEKKLDDSRPVSVKISAASSLYVGLALT